MSNLEQIEAWLNGELSETDRTAFEQRMEADPAFMTEVNTVKTLIKGVRRASARNFIQRIEAELEAEGFFDAPPQPENMVTQQASPPSHWRAVAAKMAATVRLGRWNSLVTSTFVVLVLVGGIAGSFIFFSGNFTKKTSPENDLAYNHQETDSERTDEQRTGDPSDDLSEDEAQRAAQYKAKDKLLKESENERNKAKLEATDFAESHKRDSITRERLGPNTGDDDLDIEIQKRRSMTVVVIPKTSGTRGGIETWVKAYDLQKPAIKKVEDFLRRKEFITVDFQRMLPSKTEFDTYANHADLKKALLLKSKAKIFVEVDMQPRHSSKGTSVKVSLAAYTVSDNALIVAKSGANRPLFSDDYDRLSELALLSRDEKDSSSTTMEAFIQQMMNYLKPFFLQNTTAPPHH